MNIQIGLPCGPQWLCQGIGWVIALLVILGLIGLVNIIRRDQRAQKKRSEKRFHDNDKKDQR